MGTEYIGAGEGNRTLATSLEGWGSTTELHPHLKKWRNNFLHSSSYGAEDEIRTRDPRLGKAMLYHWATPAYLLSLFGGGEWIWTTESLANGFTVRPLWPLGNSSVIIPLSMYQSLKDILFCPAKHFWSWREELNPQPTDYKSVALPIELCRQLRRYLSPNLLWRPGWGSNPRPLAWQASILNQLNYRAMHGGRYRARTCDPLLVRQMLSQLS